MEQPAAPQHTPRKQSISRGKKIGLIAGGLFILFLLLDALSHLSSTTTTPVATNTASTQAAEPSPAAVRQATIAKYAPLYCTNHRSLHMSTNAFTDNQGWPLFNGTRAWTASECEAIIGKLYDAGSNNEHLQALAAGKYAVGMTLHELIYAIGVPTNVQTTTYSDYTQQQLVYGDPLYNATYIYVDNGIVTSIQN